MSSKSHDGAGGGVGGVSGGGVDMEGGREKAWDDNWRRKMPRDRHVGYSTAAWQCNATMDALEDGHLQCLLD